MPRRRSKSNEGLPPYVYLKKGRYVIVTYDKETKKQKERYLCDGSLSRAKVWQVFELAKGIEKNTLRWLAGEFHKSPIFKGLAKSTRRDYELCRNKVIERQTSKGVSTGDLPLSAWTPGYSCAVSV